MTAPMHKHRPSRKRNIRNHGCPPTRAKTRPSKETNMKYRIRDIIADLIGVISIFGTGYMLLLINYGLGL